MFRNQGQGEKVQQNWQEERRRQKPQKWNGENSEAGVMNPSWRKSKGRALREDLDLGFEAP